MSLVPPRTTIFRFRSGFRCLVFHNQWHHPCVTILSNPTLGRYLLEKSAIARRMFDPGRDLRFQFFRVSEATRASAAASIALNRGSSRMQAFSAAWKVTIALPLRSVDAETYGFSGVQFFRNPYSYELEETYSPQLLHGMRFCSPGGEGTNDGTWRLNGTDVRPRCSNGPTGANANARRYNVKPHIRIPQVQRLPSRPVSSQ